LTAPETISTITFNRPAAHNALDRKCRDELADAVRAVKNDRDCRFPDFPGAGDTFCAGDDIKDFLTWTDDDPYWQARQYQETAQMIEDLDVYHDCRGGWRLHRLADFELTLTCDFGRCDPIEPGGECRRSIGDITPGWGGRHAALRGRRTARPRNGIDRSVV